MRFIYFLLLVLFLAAVTVFAVQNMGEVTIKYLDREHSYPLAAIVAAEFVVHYLLDYSKIHYSRGVHVDALPRRFWALHGVDQLTHQLTYAAIIYIVLAAKGLA